MDLGSDTCGFNSTSFPQKPACVVIRRTPCVLIKRPDQDSANGFGCVDEKWAKIYLKCENLQVTSSFKIRGNGSFRLSKQVFHEHFCLNK